MKKENYNLWIKEVAVLVCLYVCLGECVHALQVPNNNPISVFNFLNSEQSAFTSTYILKPHPRRMLSSVVNTARLL